MNVEGRKYNDIASQPNADESLGVLDKRQGERFLTKMSMGFVYACIGYALGFLYLPFGASPFAMAFLCASNRRVPYIFAGVCLSALFSETPIVFICAYIVALSLRILIRFTLDRPRKIEESEDKTVADFLPELFSENICLRMSTACVGSFIVGIYSLIEGGFLYYDLYGSVISMLSAPIAVLLSGGLFSRRVPKENVFYFISLGAIAFGTAYAAKVLYIYGVSVAAFGAMFATLYFSRKKGMVFGIAAAIVLGLGYSPMLAPAFIFAAVSAGALWRVSSLFASVCAFSAAFAWGLYADGIGAITGLMPAVLAAALLFGVLDKLFFSMAEVKAGEVEEIKEKEKSDIVYTASLSDEKLSAAEERVKNLCEAFSSMSDFFYDLSGKMKRPLAADIKQICDRAFDACCGNCRHKSECWETHYNDTISYVASISACVHKEGKISDANIPEAMKKICERLPDITDEINYNSALHAKQLLLCDKTEIFALDYEAISNLLASALRDEGAEFEYEKELCDKLCSVLSKMKLGMESAAVFGKKKKNILIVADDISMLYRNESEILNVCEKICGVELERQGDVEERGDGKAYVIFSQKKKIKAEVAKRIIMSGAESEFCGDTVTVFEDSGRDKLFALISDGMGSGRDAALTSGICAMFMRKMLASSDSCSDALKMLNGFLRNKGGGSMHECSATVDLLELDMVQGKAAFYKSGAAPSYVFRDGSLFKLRSKTVPVGIIKELDAKRLSFDIGNGDVIVMVSDGVTQGKDECPWLFELLKKNISSEGIERTAEMVAERARRENGNDDISVVIVKVGA